MRNVSVWIGMVTLFLASLQNGRAEAVITAQDYAVDSDVVLESVLKEVKSLPRDTVNLIGDAVKMVSDETITSAKGIAAVFKSDPVVKVEQRAALQTARAWNSASDILFRSYKISDLVGSELARGSDFECGTSVDVSGFFAGVKFPKGTMAKYRPDFKKLLVRQTLENILSIESVLAEQNNAQRELMGKQIEIQAKFIEVSQNTLEELGFNWRFDSKYGAGAKLFENLILPAGQDIMSAGLRTATQALGTKAGAGALLLQKTSGSLQWSLIINALEQSEDSDVLSAPRLTTLDGKTASIWVGEQRMIPTEFEARSQNTSVFVEHSGWESELVGVQLEVTPELLEEGLINLELKPRVMDFLGYDTYQVTPTGRYGPDGNSASMIIWARGRTGIIGKTGRYPIVSRLADGTQNALGKLYSAVLGNTVYARPADSAAANGSSAFYYDWDYTNLSDINDHTVTGGLYKGPTYGYYSSYQKALHETDGLPVPSLKGTLPYFRLREMETSVTISDGSTLGMGGLIYDKLETYRDKVPVLGSIPLLGRLFRSEGERSIKRNLMIFVTATQVDVNGRKASDLAMKR